MSFGTSLKSVMDKKGVKQEELAEGINKKQATISGYVNDNIEPGITTVKAIAEFLKVSVSELIGETEEEE